MEGEPGGNNTEVKRSNQGRLAYLSGFSGCSTSRISMLRRRYNEGTRFYLSWLFFMRPQGHPP